jgi:hypothetical protein
MPKINQHAIAVNAAGIADAFRIAQIADHDGESRIEEIARSHEGWVVVMERIAEAGEIMERYRVQRGATATWGGELPHSYDIWDAIAQSLWTGIESAPLVTLVRQAIEQAAIVEAE